MTTIQILVCVLGSIAVLWDVFQPKLSIDFLRRSIKRTCDTYSESYNNCGGLITATAIFGIFTLGIVAVWIFMLVFLFSMLKEFGYGKS